MKRWIASTLLLAALQAAAFAAFALDLQGHRGARGLAPENTLPGFAKALAIGVDTLETDIAISRDGQLVISHDPALNPDITRGPDGQFLTARGPLIWQTDFDALRRYDVGRLKPGTRYASLYPAQVAADGARLPTLAELFALVKKSGNTSVRFALETKLTPMAPDDTMAPEPFARALIKAIREAGMAERSQVLSFDWRTLQIVQREAPEIATVYLTAQQRWLDNVGADKPKASAWTAGFKYADHGSVPKLIKAAGGRIWSCFHGDLDAAKVREAKALGLTVLAWTVNEPVDIARALDLNVDGIVSDRPDRVAQKCSVAACLCRRARRSSRSEARLPCPLGCSAWWRRRRREGEQQSFGPHDLKAHFAAEDQQVGIAGHQGIGLARGGQVQEGQVEQVSAGRNSGRRLGHLNDQRVRQVVGEQFLLALRVESELGVGQHAHQFLRGDGA